jgi:signal transduction histidine kinase/ketosteroid isomerase-like protein
MNITEVIKQELTQWIETYWATYLKGDLKTWATFLRDDYRNIGGTKEEIWNSKQEILEYTSRMMDQMKGHVEFRNRKVDVISYGSQVMLHEFTDVYIKIEGEWILYGPFRMSSLLEKTDNGWVAVHQHGSYPDMKAMEGEAFSTNALKAENARLQEAVKTRTIELEIEAALERVRSTAMGMKKPDDMLDVCRVIAAQLQQFGVNNIRNVQTAIIDENIGQYLCYQYFPAYGETTIEDTQYHKSPVENEMARQMLVSRDGHFIGSLKGKELDEFRTHRKAENQFSDPLLEEASEVSYCFLSIGEGGLGLSLYHNMEQKDLTLFRRFHQVFNLAYQRFRDIRKAEAQVREAQIEAALERVRASSMAMMDSSALSVIIYKLYEELTKLDAKLDRAFIMIVNPENQGITWWLAGKEGLLAENGFFIQNNQHPSHLMYLEKWENRTKKWQYLFEGKEKKDWDRFGFSETELSKLPDFIKEDMAAVQGVYLSGSSDQFGSLVTGSIEPLPEEQQNILSRFAAVFNQTYTRFLDLQKAEAQAREAKIEAALERVRSRSMAMHKSEELEQVILVVSEQLQQLQFKFDNVSFGFDTEQMGLNFWLASPQLSKPFLIKVPYIDNPAFNRPLQARKKGVYFNIDVLSREENLQFLQHMFDYSDLRHIPAESKNFLFGTPGFARSQSLMKNTILTVGNYAPAPYSQEQNAIIKRFGNAFEQAYVRFLDLQKAEAQAREAKIEAALERVRSRSMAMHKSEELKDVIKVVLEQFIHLSINVEHAGFYIDYKAHDDMHIWLADPNIEPFYTTLPYFDTTTWNSFLEAKTKGTTLHTDLLDFKTKNKFYKSLFKLFTVPEEAKQFYMQCKGLAVSTVLLDNVGLYIENFSAIPYTDEENKILIRFGNVFQQTYTRFLDLQKAEAQAKEAQIQLALERVRARTMAMQKSDELPEAATLLFQQVQSLGMPAWSAGYCTWDEDMPTSQAALSAVTLWMSSEGVLQPPFTAPTTKDELFIQMRKGYEQGKTLHVVEMGGKKLEKHYEYMRTLPVVGEILDSIIKAGHPLPTFQIMHQAYFSKGFLLFITYEPVPESHDLFQRFAKVFDQTYTRFIDLQKAEAQAREAQIETALERVRSASMAMHKSDELKDVVAILFQNLQDLQFGIDKGAALVMTFSPDNYDHTQWISDATQTYAIPFHIPYSKHKITLDQIHARENGIPFYAKLYTEKEKNTYFQFLFQNTEYKQVPEEVKKLILDSKDFGISIAFEKNSAIAVPSSEGKLVTGDEMDILKRFAKVFEQSYTRFLDLQKAEAQAREAQIEAALERVRSRSMAMHKSEEFPEVIQVVFEQFQQLDFKIDSAQFDLSFRETDDFNLWTAVPGQPYPVKQHIPYMNNAIFNSIKKAKEAGLDFVAHQYTVEEKNEFFEYFFQYYPNVSEERKKFIFSGPGFSRSVVLLAKIELSITNYSGSPYTEEQNNILRRFANVFEQTYTRFLDLQKAEAQAREAQIEAALERIRARALAMHKSDEFTEVAKVMREQMGLLGQPELETSAVHLYDEDPDYILSWRAFRLSSDLVGEISFGFFRIPKNSCTIARTFVQKFKSEASAYSIEVSGAEQTEWYKILFKLAPEVHEAMKKSGTTKEKRYYYFSKFTGGALLMVTSKEPATDTMELQKRSALVFDLAYRRFKDLQKAEAQAREAQIEAALEKVRSRSLAMQKPGELTEVAELLRKEMGQLGVEELETSSIYIVDKENKQAECWYAIKDVREENKQLISDEMTITFADTWVGSEMGKFYRAKKEHSSIVMKGDIRKEWINYCAGKSKVLQGYYGDDIPERTYHLVKFNGGYMGAASPGAISAESWDLLRRAASVFSLAYTRFKDLQDAAERAREAQIELALERVRSKTMAMHNSQEVGESVASLFEELVTLGLLGVEDRCGIGIMQPEEIMELWTAEKTSGKTSLTIGHLDMQYHKLGRNVYQNWLDKKETYQYILEGDDKLQYYESIRKQSNYTIKKDYYSAYEKIVHSDFYFKEGCLYVFSLDVLSEESTKVFMRFASVFGQTYRRYLDLQNAEALALDTVKRSSVDRVRAEIASMRTRKDLERITPLIWRELTILGIDFIRCGVFIMDEKTEEIQTFLSTPDGNALSTFRLGYEATGQSRQIVAHWHDKKVFKDHMDEAAFIEYTKDLVRLGAVANNEKYVTENLPKDLYLHFLPFLQGMLYVGNVSQLNDDDLELVQHLADAFSTAYARYEDFSRLEEAKAIVEAAMNELKDTQNQLVQQEKLASLGQLTAGIAHEIKNPLNFVNNFSEVSLEMLEEIAEERAKSPDSRDEGLIDEILSDVRSNLKKVHEHGTRANGIVNSMLQHSRGGTGKKEETDLNVLIKEYVNLSFHGMRAGKNPINVDIALILDEKIGWVQLIKEDFTRVIINLCNNAFDAMRSKTLTDQSRNYLPKLTVTSKKEGKTITITVMDNGPGIPDDIKEKILQPFFTTKKGTEGTGLGLSITNDIIKAHGGELNIESQVGEGTAFIIQIPVV